MKYMYDAQLFSVMFYVGRCDGAVDCPGGLVEDEGGICETESIAASCLDWYLKGKSVSGRFKINPKGSSEYHCLFHPQLGNMHCLIHME